MKRLSSAVFPVAKSPIRPETEQDLHRGLEHGFTLVELIVIVAIIGGLVAIATLGIPEWRANITLKTTARDVVSHFQFARVEGAKRNASILIQVTAGGSGTGGCIVFVDNGQGGGTAGDSIPNGGETLRGLPLPPNVQVTALEQPVGTVVAGPNATYQVNNRGFPDGAGPGKVTLSNGKRSYDIELKPAGGISLSGPN